MSNMCLVGKNKKGEKSSNFFRIFLIIINQFFYVCKDWETQKKNKKHFF
jgi:hypothetical protein